MAKFKVGDVVVVKTGTTKVVAIYNAKGERIK